MAKRPAPERPDLILVGRAGKALTEVAGEARAAGANVETLGCDLSRLHDVRAAAAKTTEVLASGLLRPLRGLIANADSW
jgi:short-subunit dehydrogenase